MFCNVQIIFFHGKIGAAVFVFIGVAAATPCHPLDLPLLEWHQRQWLCSDYSVWWGQVRTLASSYLRSASSAICLASFSWISCSSIFSSSFIALFSITFMPLEEEWWRHITTGHDMALPVYQVNRMFTVQYNTVSHTVQYGVLQWYKRSHRLVMNGTTYLP